MSILKMIMAAAGASSLSKGVNWTYQASLANTGFGAAPVYALAHDGSKFVAVGYQGRVATSVDGVTWIHRPQLATTTWGTRNVGCIAWNGSLFVIGGTSGGLATSPDGITWTWVNFLHTVGASTRTVACMGWGGGKFAAVVSHGYVATSSDGITWSSYVVSGWNGSTTAKSIAWGNDIFSFCTSSSENINSNSTGTSWSKNGSSLNLAGTPFEDKGANAIIFTNGVFVVAGFRGRLATSINARDWGYKGQLDQDINWVGDARGLAWNGETLVIAGENGSIATSSDGSATIPSRTVQPSLRTTTWGTTEPVLAITSGLSAFVVAGLGGKTALSLT